MATSSANVSLVLPAVAFFGAEDFVSANAGFLISSKDEEEEVGASLQISAESFIWSCWLPSLLVVYVACLLLLVGGGEGDGDGDGDGEGDGEVITVPHIVWPESGRLPVDYQRTTTRKLYEFSYNFPVAVWWLSHRTISPMDFPMDCLVNRHRTYT